MKALENVDFYKKSKGELQSYQKEFQQKYANFQAQDLQLNMTRGIPSVAQLNLSMGLLDVLNSQSVYKSEAGIDCRNYGIPYGLPEVRAMFADLLDIQADQIIIGGNSSLKMMYDIVSLGMNRGFNGCKPWGQQGKIKFLCPSPGYDRHFSITEFFGFDMIPIPMTLEGPDMNLIESLVSNNESIKGIWCIPKYSNPEGITYSDETVRRFAALKPLAKDFRIFLDNAYCVHELTEEPDQLLNLIEECEKAGNPDHVIMFTSTSKILFPGAGLAILACTGSNLAYIQKAMSFQTIGPDKLNQLRHLYFFKNAEGVKTHMKKHRVILKNKFDLVLGKLKTELAELGVANWHSPRGGYFVSVNVMEGCAKRVVALCKEAGLLLTRAGATFPYHQDPKDQNIRVAPTFPPLYELEQAMDLFCLCVKLAAVEKILA